MYDTFYYQEYRKHIITKIIVRKIKLFVKGFIYIEKKKCYNT